MLPFWQQPESPLMSLISVLFSDYRRRVLREMSSAVR